MKKSRKPDIQTVGDHIAWSYANLARADAALSDGVSNYQTVHHMIRAKLFKGLKNGTMKIASFYDDERIKMTVSKACCYCGGQEQLSVDHLIPRVSGGSDDPDNLILACRSCNSSKRGCDMMEWMKKKQEFPSILLLRRYLKLVAKYCIENNLMSVSMPDALQQDLPFDLLLCPHSFPPLQTLTLWVTPSSVGDHSSKWHA